MPQNARAYRAAPVAEQLDYPRTVFVERQSPRGWPLWLALTPVAIAGSGTLYMSLFLGGAPAFIRVLTLTLLVIAPTLVFMQRLVVVVTSHEVTIRYSLLRSKRINLADIAHAKPDTYEPIKEFGGWGLKWSLRDSTTSYTMHGNQGVRLMTTTGKKILIGSQRAKELADAINRAMHPPTGQ